MTNDQSPTDPKLLRELVSALERCAARLEDELGAAGPEEVRQHPTLQAHSKAVAAARRVLAKVAK